MGNLHQLLKDYQQLQTLSRRILGLASNKQWDELVAQEIAYIQAVEKLSQTAIPDNIDSVMKLHFRKILNEIVENESQIKELLRKRMDELSSLMKDSVTQKNINSAYGEFAGHRFLPGDVGNP
ncbi:MULTISPECIES: flagella biosynthesis regulatory protein FliT [Pectobacterium]|uniref:Flagellar protein FliT n=1 Tax=Pectobacterium versatile TaxID=2488639 RepID=A0A855MEC3_9GAMM|nr:MULTISPECIES: flagella biosynthesis regulatory protein FliT [Pectobacterium]MBQ4775574.1 flagella biosynthesis regulatory protein FliT [Pectobacterium versatile]MCA6973799.1 flagella biosynthesis regulatory protein FliT [Pectobacterium carotovorum]POY49103.1 flagellar biosynthesis protein FliT [Pectobacterium versatile]QPK14333.1 flagella biosynthesis regulatory protein FliT [Pectobacterium versatile]WJM82595.1 flagella biosynthesis regulatory protein FliT [Pectobacterium brasiliense]